MFSRNGAGGGLVSADAVPFLDDGGLGFADQGIRDIDNSFQGLCPLDPSKIQSINYWAWQTILCFTMKCDCTISERRRENVDKFGETDKRSAGEKLG